MDDWSSIFLAFVSSQSSDELTRKSSFETRAFSLVTATLALVTIWLTLDQNLKLAARIAKSNASWLLPVAVICSTGAIICAVASATPTLLRKLPPRELVKLFDNLSRDNPPSSLVTAALARTQIESLRSRARANSIRAWLLLVATILFLLGTAAAIVAFAVSWHIEP